MDEIYAFLANNKDSEGRRLAECHLNRMEAIKTKGFNEAKRLAMEECDKYIARFKKASEATSDIQAQFSYRDMIRAAESCKSWIETIKEPA